MEMEQIVESITKIGKRVAIRRIANAGKDNQLKLIAQEVTKNRPLLMNFVKQSSYQNSNPKKPKQENTYFEQSNERELPEMDKYYYLIEFDKSIDLAPAWIDADTLRLFNSLRSNIYVSSSMFDEIHLRAQQNTFAKKEPIRQQPPR